MHVLQRFKKPTKFFPYCAIYIVTDRIALYNKKL